jgi:hypothetical protein
MPQQQRRGKKAPPPPPGHPVLTLTEKTQEKLIENNATMESSVKATGATLAAKLPAMGESTKDRQEAARKESGSNVVLAKMKKAKVFG